MDYRKKLNEYRKCIKSNVLKTVEFKDSKSRYVEDKPAMSLGSPLEAFHYQQFTMQENEPILKILRSVPIELSFSKTASPQTQTEHFLARGIIKENCLLSEYTGRYINWNSKHTLLASQPWCSIGDLLGFCDKYQFKAIIASDLQTHTNIVSEIKTLLNGKAPFDINRRFSPNIRNGENLQVCIGRCPGIEYHLQRIINIFRRPLSAFSMEKQNILKQNFHIAVKELRFDLSEARLYDRTAFEKEFNLKWQSSLERNTLHS